MAPTPSTSQAGAPKYSDVKIPASMDDLVQFLLSTSDSSVVLHVLRSIGTPETREQALAAQLSNGEDPLSLLDVETQTLGWLFIL